MTAFRRVVYVLVTIVYLGGIGFFAFVLTGGSAIGTAIVMVAFAIIAIPVIWWARASRSN
jgi:hypothetical protein